MDLLEINNIVYKLMNPVNKWIHESYKDRNILALKEIIEERGSSKIEVIAAAVMIIKEKDLFSFNREYLEDKLNEYISLLEDGAVAGAPANCVGGGNIAGIGVGAHGEPGFSPRAMSKYKKKNKMDVRRIMSMVGMKRG